ncbi:probable serine/threonine-protein kinase PBL19 isoform X2 [Nymphaea colorata]|nr:probable serine/threonine-protein kinase PBL19 isoform X2 [Nymphaea colorata]
MTCFGFLKDIPETLKSNLSNLKWGVKHWTGLSGSSKNSKRDTKGSGDEGRKTGGSDKTGGSGKSGGSESGGLQKSVLELYEERAQNLRVFTVGELKSATNNFSPELKIGEGGFGSVYRGYIKPVDGSAERKLVAVKKLNRNGLQGHKEWVAEVQLLGIADHPNVVKLIGYCAVDGERGIQRLLVYEFMPNRSLEDHLFNRLLPVLSWERRLQIALGTAQGLAYLHEELEVQVIFRDFKASNVLLDLDFRPRLSDFGLAREGPSAGRTHVTTAIVGTFGYAAPEYIRTGHLTAKSDVWSFGVVLYELLTGRRSMERNRPKNERKLLEWIKNYPVSSRKFQMIIDPRLGDHYSLPAAQAVAKLADSCLLKLSTKRPDMSKVVETLKQIIELSKGEDSQETVQAAKSESVGTEGRLDKVDVSNCEDGLPDNSRRKVTPMTGSGKENGRVFGRRRFIMMSQQNQQLQQHHQHLHQHQQQQQQEASHKQHEQEHPVQHKQRQQEPQGQQKPRQQEHEQQQQQEHHEQLEPKDQEQQENHEQLQQQAHHEQNEPKHQEQQLLYGHQKHELQPHQEHHTQQEQQQHQYQQEWMQE